MTWFQESFWNHNLSFNIFIKLLAIWKLCTEKGSSILFLIILARRRRRPAAGFDEYSGAGTWRQRGIPGTVWRIMLSLFTSRLFSVTNIVKLQGIEPAWKKQLQTDEIMLIFTSRPMLWFYRGRGKPRTTRRCLTNYTTYTSPKRRRLLRERLLKLQYVFACVARFIVC